VHGRSSRVEVVGALGGLRFLALAEGEIMVVIASLVAARV
jgi:hypothetical protein